MSGKTTIRIEWPTHKRKAAQAKARKLRWKKKGKGEKAWQQ